MRFQVTLLAVVLASAGVAGAQPCQAPVATIVEPAAGATYAGGETIRFAGAAADPRDGALGPAALRWEVAYHRAGDPQPFLASTSGIASGAFTVPALFDTSSDVFFRVHLTARNACGRTHHVTRDVMPRLARITLDTRPPALPLELDGRLLRAPVTFTGVAGITRGIAGGFGTFAGELYAFESWSDGGAIEHDIATPAADATITQTLREWAPPRCLTVPAGGGFANVPFPVEARGPLTVEFAAQPQAAPINATVGLASGVQTRHAGFAALVRFNDAGHIDARDGGRYAAAAAIPYAAGVTYNFRLVVNVLTHRYSIFVRPDGVSQEATVGVDFAFRSEQDGAGELSQVGTWVAAAPGGALKVCALDVRPVDCIAVAAPAWRSELFIDIKESDEQRGAFDTEFEITPSHAPTNAVFGISPGSAADYGQLAGIVRFAPSGRIDARNGDRYQAASSIPYSAGATYRFRMAVSVPAHRYSVFVRPPGSATELTVARDFAFRTEQSAVEVLEEWAGHVAPRGHRITACDLDVSEAPRCRTLLEPAAQTVGAGGATASVFVDVESATTRGGIECPWQAASHASFITIVHRRPQRGGDGTVVYTVAPNPGPARTGTIEIGGETLTVTQEGAP